MKHDSGEILIISSNFPACTGLTTGRCNGQVARPDDACPTQIQSPNPHLKDTYVGSCVTPMSNIVYFALFS